MGATTRDHGLLLRGVEICLDNIVFNEHVEAGCREQDGDDDLPDEHDPGADEL